MSTDEVTHTGLFPPADPAEGTEPLLRPARLLNPTEPGPSARRIPTDRPPAAMETLDTPDRTASRMHLTWVTGSGRALAARVDVPTSPEVVGAVVVVPSFGREAVVSYRTVKALSVRAARSGFIGLSFAFSGDGDSECLRPQDDPQAAWVADLGSIAALARDLVGPEAPVHFVGLRLGSAVLSALPATGPGERVHWEPVSGRSYLLTHSMLRRQSARAALQPGTVELDGIALTESQAKGIAAMRAPRASRHGIGAADPQSVRLETDREAGKRLALGAPFYARVPLGSIDEIIAGLSRGAPRRPNPWTPSTTLEIARPGEPRIRERWCTIGPDALPGIVTDSPDVAPRMTTVFTAMGSEVRSGPGNLWTILARDLAASGTVSLRADRRFLGDSVDPDATQEPRPYTDRSVADVAAAIDHARSFAPTGPIIAVGVCAGAWSLLRALGETRVDRVLAVNPVHWNPDALAYTEAFYRTYHRELSQAVIEDSAQTPPASTSERTLTSKARDMTTAGVCAAQRLVRRARHRLALRYPVLRTLIRRELVPEHVGDLLGVVPPRTAVMLAFAPEDHDVFVGKGGPKAVRRANAHGADLTVAVDPAIDHNLFAASGRRYISDLLRAEVETAART